MTSCIEINRKVEVDKLEKEQAQLVYYLILQMLIQKVCLRWHLLTT